MGKLFTISKRKNYKILVLRTEHIGDYILSLPALKALRIKFPNAKIDVVVGSWNKLLAERTPYINQVIVFDNPLIKRNLGYPGLFKEVFFGRKIYSNFFKKVNKEKYPLFISFSNRKISSFLNINVNSSNKILGTNYNFGRIPEYKRIEKILNSKGVPSRFSMNQVNLNVLSNEKKKINLILKKFNSKRFIVVHPMTPLQEKNWPLEKWGELLTKINKKIIFIDLPQSKLKIDNIINKFNLKNKSINLCGELNLIETYYLISKASLFIGGDSGPMHLAELTKTPILALFGPTDEKVWGPTRKGDKVIKKQDIGDIQVKEVLDLLA